MTLADEAGNSLTVDDLIREILVSSNGCSSLVEILKLKFVQDS